MMQTRYTIAMSWLVALACTAFVLNSGTTRSQASSSSDDLQTLLSVANAVVAQSSSNPIIDRMRNNSSAPAGVVSPAAVQSAKSNIDRYIEVANEIDPKLGKILSRICTERGQDPAELERMIRRYGRGLVALADLQASDPALYRMKIQELGLDAEVNDRVRLLRKIEAEHGPDSAAAHQAREVLQAVMRSRLSLSIRNRTRSIERIAEHVEQLQERLQHDEDHFDQEIDRQLDQLMGQLDAVQAARGR